MESYEPERIDECRRRLINERRRIERKLTAIYLKHNWDHEKTFPLTRPLIRRREEIDAELLSIKAYCLQPGDHVSLCPYSDWHSYTIVSRTKFMLTARADRQTKFKVDAQDGELLSEPDPNGKTITLTWSKKKGWWCHGIYLVCLGKRNYKDPAF